jgi:16S rRNA (guanine(966)-N(2))-methyltransferase RsmD
MRIVSGTLKGRRFSPPSNFKARPTTDYAKENLFNVLNNTFDFEEIKVLDLFSGTGSISFEFVSRGCTDVTSVELNFRHQQFIARMVHELNLQDKMRAIKSDAFRFAERTSDRYDIIFADPPFDLEKAAELPDLIIGRKLLKEDGVFILEHSDKINYSNHPNYVETRDYGKVNFSFFTYNNHQE